MLPSYRGSSSALFLCASFIYTSPLLIQAFFVCFQKVPKACVLFQYYAFCQPPSLSEDFNSLVFSIFISVPKGTQRFPSKPKTPPSSEVPQTKPSKHLVYLRILISVSYEYCCYPWSFRFICIPWAYMLEHSSKDKTQYHVSWHLEFISNLVSLKSLPSVLFYIFSHCNRGHFLCSWQVKWVFSVWTYLGFGKVKVRSKGVIAKRKCWSFFLSFSNHILVFLSQPQSFIHNFHSPYIVQRLKMCNTFSNVDYTAWYRAMRYSGELTPWATKHPQATSSLHPAVGWGSEAEE